MKKPSIKVNKSIDRLYNAVAYYVKKSGGTVVVAGGIEIQRWPEDRKGQFRVAIKCLGKAPDFSVKGNR